MIVARVALLTAVAVAVICLAAPSSAQSRFSLLWDPNLSTCGFAFVPTAADAEQAQEAVEKCIGSSVNLQTVIEIIFGDILGSDSRRRRSIGGSSNSIEDSNSNESSNEGSNSNESSNEGSNESSNEGSRRRRSIGGSSNSIEDSNSNESSNEGSNSNESSNEGSNEGSRRRRSIGGSSNSIEDSNSNESSNEDSNSNESSNEGSNEGSNENGNFALDLSKLPRLEILYQKMGDAGFNDSLLELGTCVAAELDLLSADGTFDTAALQVFILQKVDGTSVEDNTQSGIDNCPPVSNFDIGTYLICISTYCVTGAGP